MTYATFTMEVNVYDPDSLAEAAVRQLIKDGIDEVEARSDVRDDEGNVDIEYCLVMLLDPGIVDDAGFSINDSGAEAHYHLDDES